MVGDITTKSEHVAVIWGVVKVNFAVGVLDIRAEAKAKTLNRVLDAIAVSLKVAVTFEKSFGP
jgi:hypothetical protein